MDRVYVATQAAVKTSAKLGRVTMIRTDRGDVFGQTSTLILCVSGKSGANGLERMVHEYKLARQLQLAYLHLMVCN